jgi:hypothetical protein
VLANDAPGVTADTLTVSAVDGLSTNVGAAVAGVYGTLTLDADSASGPSALPSSGVSEDFFGYTALEGGPAGGGSASSTLSVVVTAPGLTYVAAPAGARPLAMARKPSPEPDFDRFSTCRRSSGGGNGRPRVEAVLFAAAKPVTRDILARVVGRDCALDQPCDHFLHGF